jgi:hypothetical protein
MAYFFHEFFFYSCKRGCQTARREALFNWMFFSCLSGFMVRTTAVFDLIHLSEKLTLDSATQAHNLED